MTDATVPLSRITAGNLTAEVYPSRRAMGKAAADHVATYLQGLLADRDEVRIVVGSAPSQDEFFAHLTASENLARVDWARVVVFHMDEYVGLPADHPQTFRRYQEIHLLSKVRPKAFHGIRGEESDAMAECRRLTELLTQAPIDLVCLGIGENGHLAFNDPPAPFDDPEWVKVVELDAMCRQQQVNDGCFPTVNDVPARAITLTLRVFREAAKLSGVVPGPRKAHAVAATLSGPVSEACPATLMRRHPNARLFLDADAAGLIER